jgi:hypothetical protein
MMLTASDMSRCRLVVPCFVLACNPYALYILGPRSGGLNALGNAWTMLKTPSGAVYCGNGSICSASEMKSCHPRLQKRFTPKFW